MIQFAKGTESGFMLFATKEKLEGNDSSRADSLLDCNICGCNTPAGYNICLPLEIPSSLLQATPADEFDPADYAEELQGPHLHASGCYHKHSQPVALAALTVFLSVLGIVRKSPGNNPYI